MSNKLHTVSTETKQTVILNNKKDITLNKNK